MIIILIGLSMIILSILTFKTYKGRLLNNDCLFLILTNYLLTIALLIFNSYYLDKLLTSLSSLFLVINSTCLLWEIYHKNNKYNILAILYYSLILYLFFFLFQLV